MPLSPRNQAALAALSRAHVENSLASARRFFQYNRWLAKDNVYASDILTTLGLPGHSINSRHLAQYIAVSSLLHCTDGWSYLGRSLQALMFGDANTSFHLAYYAELRAAMSLLSCEGVGVLKKQHFVVSGPNSARSLPTQSTTHAFVWDCLSYWSELPASGALFATVVRPHAKTLDDWLTPIGGGARIGPQARDWFQQWGMDLRLLAQDREARNEVSYRPRGISRPVTIDVAAASEFVRDLWGLLEPTGPSSFDGLDRYILRIALEREFKGRSGSSARRSPAKFRSFLVPIVDSQNMTSAVAEAWTGFLLRQNQPNDPTSFRLAGLAPGHGVDSHFAIISRATLLLRIASGATARLFEAAGVRREGLEFWRDRIGSGRLWGVDGDPEPLTDLWTDVAASLSEVEHFCSGPPATHTYHHLGSAFSSVFAPLGSCELVAVWTIAAA